MDLPQGVRIGSLVFVSALLLAACSGAATSPSSTTPSGSGSASASNVPASSAAPTEAVVPIGLADVGDCFDYTYAEGVRDVWRYDGVSVDCAAPHTAVTIATWPATELVDLPPAGAMPKADQDAFDTQTTADRDRCTQKAQVYLGSGRPSSLGTNLLFGQNDEGSIEARCDIIRTSVAGTNLLPLPAQAQGVLAGGGWRAYGQCITEKAKKVACTRGRYLIVADGQLNPDLNRGPFPGPAESTRLTTAVCKGKGYPGAPNSQEAWEAGGYYACLRPWTP